MDKISVSFCVPVKSAAEGRSSFIAHIRDEGNILAHDKHPNLSNRHQIPSHTIKVMLMRPQNHLLLFEKPANSLMVQHLFTSEYAMTDVACSLQPSLLHNPYLKRPLPSFRDLGNPLLSPCKTDVRSERVTSVGTSTEALHVPRNSLIYFFNYYMQAKTNEGEGRMLECAITSVLRHTALAQAVPVPQGIRESKLQVVNKGEGWYQQLARALEQASF